MHTYRYVNAFAQKFDLLKHITFSCRVNSVKKDTNTGKWVATIKPGEGTGFGRCDKVQVGIYVYMYDVYMYDVYCMLCWVVHLDL